MLGTLVNVGAVIIGSLLGLVIHKRMPEKITKLVFQAIGLFTLFLGFTMASKTTNYLIMIFSLVIGSIIGELLNIEKQISKLSDWLKSKSGSSNAKFSEGFLTSFLLFCMGSMTILGAIEEGLGGNPDLLLAKSVLDGFSSIALAAAMGIGVLFSAIPLFIYQGGLTLFAGYLQDYLTTPMINELSAVGGIILIGLGVNILEIKKIRVINMTPALFVAVILVYYFVNNS
ncbi:MAG: DUF554 domain-containing protein [Bacteroidetes bacterium]|nr:MAG: DUF554 domain-containing protein [Bacteroidota bacterium]